MGEPIVRRTRSEREAGHKVEEVVPASADLTANEAGLLEALAAEEIAKHKHPPHALISARDKLRERAERGR